MKCLLVFFIAFLLSVSHAYAKPAKTTALRQAARVEQRILEGYLADETVTQLGNLLGLGAAELKRRGYRVEADRMLSEWRSIWKNEFMLFATSSQRDIGSHYALNEWLASQMRTLELLLGTQILKSTHLSDIVTFLYCPQIVFRPKTFPMDDVPGERIDEYRRHFNEGRIYGMVPVVVYWATYAAVSAVPGGYVIVAGLAGDVAEKLFASFVGGRLSDWVYKKATGQLMANSDELEYY